MRWQDYIEIGGVLALPSAYSYFIFGYEPYMDAVRFIAFMFLFVGSVRGIKQYFVQRLIKKHQKKEAEKE